MVKPANKHVEAFEAAHKLPGESVIAWGPAVRDGEGFEGAAILTERRVCFLRKGMLSDKFEPWPVAKVTSVESRRGMIFLDVTLHTSGDDMELKFVDKKLGQNFVDTLQQRLNADPAPQAAASQPATGGDVMEQLKKLGELRDAGIVTDEEFATKKAELLARI